jgi:hypothetical protein
MRPSSNCKLQTRPLVREGAPHQLAINCQNAITRKMTNWSQVSYGCLTPRQTGQLVVISLRHHLTWLKLVHFTLVQFSPVCDEIAFLTDVERFILERVRLWKWYCLGVGRKLLWLRQGDNLGTKRGRETTAVGSRYQRTGTRYSWMKRLIACCSGLQAVYIRELLWLLVVMICKRPLPFQIPSIIAQTCDNFMTRCYITCFTKQNLFLKYT